MGSEPPANAIAANAVSSVSNASVIGDLPTAEPGLRFQKFAKVIADAIKSGDPPQFTVGIYGPWGSGKTSLLWSIESVLREDNNIIPVFFDAWRYERSEHIIVPLLHSVYSKVAESRSFPSKAVKNIKRAMQATVYSLNAQISSPKVPGAPSIGIGVSAKEFANMWESTGLSALDEAFAKPFSELRKLPDHLGSRRIVVLIDDLDRCSPDKVVSVLESINLVMDVRGFIFVLALDYDVLVSAINTKYSHVAGDDFVQKIIQLPFRVPDLPLDGPEKLAQLIKGWGIEKDTALTKDVLEHLHKVATLGLDSNPRQNKRLFNSFWLVRELSFDGDPNPDDLKFLATLLGIQLRWPKRFRDFQRAISSTDDPDQKDWKLQYYFQKREEEYPDLWRYAERLMPLNMCIGKIKETLWLSRSVALDNESPGDAIQYEDSGNSGGPGTSDQ